MESEGERQSPCSSLQIHKHLIAFPLDLLSPRIPKIIILVCNRRGGENIEQKMYFCNRCSLKSTICAFSLNVELLNPEPPSQISLLPAAAPLLEDNGAEC